MHALRTCFVPGGVCLWTGTWQRLLAPVCLGTALPLHARAPACLHRPSTTGSSAVVTAHHSAGCYSSRCPLAATPTAASAQPVTTAFHCCPAPLQLLNRDDGAQVAGALPVPGDRGGRARHGGRWACTCGWQMVTGHDSRGSSVHAWRQLLVDPLLANSCQAAPSPAVHDRHAAPHALAAVHG